MSKLLQLKINTCQTCPYSRFLIFENDEGKWRKFVCDKKLLPILPDSIPKWCPLPNL